MRAAPASLQVGLREHDLGAAHVRLDRAHRAVDDQSHADRGGEVHDDVGLVDQVANDAALGDRADRALEARVRVQVLDVLDAARGEIVEHVHTVPARDQQVAEVRADEAGSTRDQEAHQRARSAAARPSAGGCVAAPYRRSLRAGGSQRRHRSARATSRARGGALRARRAQHRGRQRAPAARAGSDAPRECRAPGGRALPGADRPTATAGRTARRPGGVMPAPKSCRRSELACVRAAGLAGLVERQHVLLCSGRPGSAWTPGSSDALRCGRRRRERNYEHRNAPADPAPPRHACDSKIAPAAGLGECRPRAISAAPLAGSSASSRTVGSRGLSSCARV